MGLIENLPENLMTFLISPSQGEWLMTVKVIFIIFSFFLISFIIFGLVKTSWLKLISLNDATEILTHKPLGAKRMEKEWRKIMAKLDSGLESEYKLAVIETDNMMDESLKRMGYGGESLGERLEKVTAVTLPNIEDIKKVHQLRNNIIHDPNYRLTQEEAKKTLDVFEKAFSSLEAF